MLSPYIGLSYLFAESIVLVTLVRMFVRFSPVSNEIERKLMHMSIGTCLLSLPWLLHSKLIALILMACIIFGPRIAKTMKWSRSVFGKTYSVNRKNIGAPSLGIAFLVLFIFAGQYKLFYFISGMVVVFADAAAAIIGTKFEFMPYSIVGYKKTLSGSCAFFLVAIFCVIIPLLSVGEYNFAMNLLISVTIAAIATCIEALSPFGTDNITIPLGVLLALHVLL